MRTLKEVGEWLEKIVWHDDGIAFSEELIAKLKNGSMPE